MPERTTEEQEEYEQYIAEQKANATCRFCGKKGIVGQTRGLQLYYCKKCYDLLLEDAPDIL